MSNNISSYYASSSGTWRTAGLSKLTQNMPIDNDKARNSRILRRLITTVESSGTAVVVPVQNYKKPQPPTIPKPIRCATPKLCDRAQREALHRLGELSGLIRAETDGVSATFLEAAEKVIQSTRDFILTQAAELHRAEKEKEVLSHQLSQVVADRAMLEHKLAEMKKNGEFSDFAGSRDVGTPLLKDKSVLKQVWLLERQTTSLQAEKTLLTSEKAELIADKLSLVQQLEKLKTELSLATSQSEGSFKKVLQDLRNDRDQLRAELTATNAALSDPRRQSEELRRLQGDIDCLKRENVSLRQQLQHRCDPDAVPEPPTQRAACSCSPSDGEPSSSRREVMTDVGAGAPPLERAQSPHAALEAFRKRGSPSSARRAAHSPQHHHCTSPDHPAS